MRRGTEIFILKFLKSLTISTVVSGVLDNHWKVWFLSSVGNQPFTEMCSINRAAQHEAQASDLLAAFFCRVLRRQSPCGKLQSKLCEQVNAVAQSIAYREIRLGGSVKEVEFKEIFKQGE